MGLGSLSRSWKVKVSPQRKKKTSVADPDQGSGIECFLTPGSGIRDGRKSASGAGIRDEQPGSYFLELRNHFCAFFGVKILKFFDEDPGSGMETVRIRDPGWKKVGSGIRDKHPGSATPKKTLKFYVLNILMFSGRVEAFPEAWKSFMEVQISNIFWSKHCISVSTKGNILKYFSHKMLGDTGRSGVGDHFQRRNNTDEQY